MKKNCRFVVSKFVKLSDKGPSINNAGNWEGGKGQKLVKIVLKNCRHEGGRCQQSGKIADVVYGWSLNSMLICDQLKELALHFPTYQ